MGLLQNAVFRPEKKIFVLKKLARTASVTVLANFFFDLIFQNCLIFFSHFNKLVHLQAVVGKVDNLSLIFYLNTPSDKLVKNLGD